MSKENSNRFVLDVVEFETECVVDNLCCIVEDMRLISSLTHPYDFNPSCSYDLSDIESSVIEREFGLCFDSKSEYVRLRSWCPLDGLPYKVHTNRELVLMLRGTKPLATFSDWYPALEVTDIIPDRLFDPYVACGKFDKREYIRLLDAPIPSKLGVVRGSRHVLYALPSESWRIDEYIQLWEVAAKSGWSEELERREGELLGYEDWQNDIFMGMKGNQSHSKNGNAVNEIGGRPASHWSALR
jgi:hypothetical protein